MRTSIVRRHHLDVERVIATIDVVLDPHVRELDVALVVARQVVLPRPILDLQRIAVRPAIAVVTIAIALLQELLVLALQIVLEDDAVDVRSVVAQAFGFIGIGTIKLRVVLQFSGLLDAVVERLALARVRVDAAGIEQVASLPSSVSRPCCRDRA